MTRRQRLRRVAILCLHCLRNLAYYRTERRKGTALSKNQFWVIVHNNFLDMCVLEWCKLFGDPQGQHYWRAIIANPESFFDGLLRTLKITEPDFGAYVDEMRTYRDKFLAHLDSEMVMQVPELALAQQSTCYLYDYLRASEDEGDFLADGPIDAATYYAECVKEGRSVYEAI